MRRTLLVSFALVLLVACGGGGDGQPAGGAARSGGEREKLQIKDYQFPATLTWKAGKDILIVNKDAEYHTVTADNKAFDWRVEANSKASFDAPAAGTYAYACTNHPTMKGTLTVT